MDIPQKKASTKLFKKKKEDFVCEKCGTKVTGDGYTNHCPSCLYSKHVDINPGDRASLCLGLMKPLKIEGSSGKYRIIHKCLACGYVKPNKVAEDDSIESILLVINENSNKYLEGK